MQEGVQITMAGSKGKGSRSGYQKRQAHSTKYIMSPFYDMPKDYNELVRDYRTLAKAADQRLVRLARLGEKEGFRHATEYSYRRAMHDIKAWGGESATRFNIKPPEGIANLRAKMADIKTFLSAESSTKKGLTQINQKRADTLNEKYGTNFTPKEISKFFDSKLKERMSSKIRDSDTMMKVVGVIRRNKKILQQKGVNREKKLEQIFDPKERNKFIKEVKDANMKDQEVPDEMVKEALDMILKSHAPSVRAYLNKSD